MSTSKAIETSVSVDQPTPDDTQALVVAEEQPLSINIGTFSAVPDFATEDLFMSRLRLAQGITKEVQDGSARPGQWVFTGLAPMKTVIVIPLAFTKAVRRWAAFMGGQRAMLCDHHIGAADTDCLNCTTNQVAGLNDPNRPWNGVLEPYQQFMIYMPEHKMPAILEFSKSGLAAAHQINTQILAWGFGNAAFQLGSETITGQFGPFQKATVTKVDVPREQLDEALTYLPPALAAQLQARNQQ